MDPQQMDESQLQKALGLAHAAEAKAKKDLAELKREWISRHGGNAGTEYTSSGVQAFLSPNARWDESTARLALSEAGIPQKIISQMETVTLDRKKAEDMLPPRVYRMCQKASAPKFNIRFP